MPRQRSNRLAAMPAPSAAFRSISIQAKLMSPWVQCAGSISMLVSSIANTMSFSAQSTTEVAAAAPNPLALSKRCLAANQIVSSPQSSDQGQVHSGG